MVLLKRSMEEDPKETVTKWRRSYRACVNCRSRKVKCDLGPLDNPNKPPCVRCKREQRECVIPELKKREEVLAGQNEIIFNLTEKNLGKVSQRTSNIKALYPETRRYLNEQTREVPNLVDSNWRSDMSTMQTALEFLANAAGSISKKGGRDLFSIDQKYRSNETTDNEENKILSNNNSNDDIAYNLFSNSEENLVASLHQPNGTQRAAASLIEKVRSIRPKGSKNISDIEYIGPAKMLTEEESVKLIDVFFLTMHPFFPYIPLQLQNSNELVRYPILLCAILTVSSRYNNFADIGLADESNNNRNIKIHEKLWIYCQRLISKTIWAEASTRSIGTVLAFLLFTEWNPRAIHWKWSDYANDSELSSVSKDESIESGQEFKGEHLTGIEAMRHSDRMAWMLTGSAVRLAQDMHFIDSSCKIFVATHISETYNAMNVNQRSTLSESLSNISIINDRSGRTVTNSLDNKTDTFGNELFFLKQILEKDESKERWSELSNLKFDTSKDLKEILTDLEREFLNDEYVLYYSNRDRESVPHNSSHSSPFSLPYPLKFTKIQQAKIELLRITTIGYETIYFEKDKRSLASDNQRQNLAILSIFSPLIEGWYSNYNTLLEPATGSPCDLSQCKNKRIAYEMAQKIEKESLICDYYYCQLYIYSLALQVDVKRNELKLNEITRSAKYVALAYNAAREIIDSAIRINELKFLKYIPVRWVIRIVRSVAFIVKCYITVTDNELPTNTEVNSILRLSGIPTEESLELINMTAGILKKSTPDELHLCTRYSTILLCLYKELKENRMNSSHISSNEQIGNNKVFSDLRINKPKSYLSSSADTPDITFDNRTESIFTKELISKENQDQLSNIDTPINNPNNGSFPDEVIDWFSTSADIGLEFVESWTEMIEQRYIKNGDNDNPNYEDLLATFSK